MITLYHSPISPNSRRVWITLLEKNIDFELIEVKLNGGQFAPEFLAISPFNHIPALVDDGFKIIESLAILDYLEAKYPTPTLLPVDIKDLTIVRMVEMLTVNEILTETTVFLPQIFGLPGANPERIDLAKQKLSVALKFLESLLDERPFFGSDNLTLADIVAGTVISWLPIIGIDLNEYSKLNAWCDRLIERPSWKSTQATPRMMAEFKSVVQARIEKN